jgi:hypothetical protein
LISRIVRRTIEQLATDKRTMRRVIAITATVILGLAALASAQAPRQTLADVAKAEEARRKAVPKTAKVYTNGDLETDI